MNNSGKQSYQIIPQETELIGKQTLDAAFKVHSVLGPGLLESVYEKALAYELNKNRIMVERQKRIPIKYDDQILESGFFCDLLVDNRVIVELKAVETVIPIFQAQLLTYLRLTGIRLGYLINFNTIHLKDGIKRFVN
jgi:GxxExxY protein